MSSMLDWAIAAGGPAGVLLGVVGTKVFDWRVTKKVAHKVGSEAKKFDADAAQVIATTAVTLITPLQEQITKLVVRVETLEIENTQTKTRLQLAIDHIRALRTWIRDHIPDRTPPDAPSELGI